MSKKIFISVATYNEKENIEKLIRRIFDLSIENLSIIIIDDNSPDGTARIVENLKDEFPLIHLINRTGKLGYGSAHIAGFKKALENNADIIVSMDADFSHSPDIIPKLIDALNYGNDVAIGSRRIKGGEVIGWNLWRKFCSAGAMIASQTMLGIKTRDLTSGFRAYNAQIFNIINLDNIKSDGYSFLEELIYLVEKNNLKIKEVPIVFYDRRLGYSKLSRKEIVKFFLTIFKIKFSSKNFALAAACPACYNQRAKIYLRKNDYCYVRCEKCGCIYLLSVPSNLESVYGKDYFVGSKEGGYIDYDLDKVALKDFFLQYINRLHQLNVACNPTLLDLGSATGYFVELAKINGFNAQGLDISPEAVSLAQSLGRSVRVGESGKLSDAYLQEKNNYFNFVTMWDCLEHLADIKKSFDEIDCLLKKDGWLLINTPDSGSAWARIFGKRWHSFIPPEHIIFFNKKNIKSFLEANGFKVLEIKTVHKNFTLQYIVAMLYRWQGLSMWKLINRFLTAIKMNAFKVKVPIGDNMIIIAQKIK